MDLAETYYDYLIRLKARLLDLMQLARENLGSAKEHSKKYYDKRANPCTFKVSD